MKFDFQLSVSILVMMICCLIFPFLPSLSPPLLDGMTVTAVESIQALMLLGFAVLSFFYIRPFELSQGQNSSGSGQLHGGFYCSAEVPAGGVTISRKFRKFISVVFRS